MTEIRNRETLLAIGDQNADVPYNCPNCGGVLWEKEMLWISLRMFEERKNLLTSMGKTVRRSLKRSNRQRLGATQGYIDRLRSMLLTPESQSADDTFTRVKGLMAEPPRAKSTR